MNLNGKNDKDYSEITPIIKEYADLCINDCKIKPELYVEHKVNRGLRDLNGNGVLTGLTEISEIVSKKTVNGETVPCPGKLYYRGYDIENLVAGFVRDNRFGFEEVTYLLLFNKLPDENELADFTKLLAKKV